MTDTTPEELNAEVKVDTKTDIHRAGIAKLGGHVNAAILGTGTTSLEPLETGIREKDRVTGSRNRADLERDTLVRDIHLNIHLDIQLQGVFLKMSYFGVKAVI